MPTTTVETPITDVPFARRVAKELSFWWRRQGADLNHVITKFVPAQGTVYSGPFPLDGAFAIVSCVVSHDRGPDFKRAYARHVRTTLGPEIPADRVFVSFYPTDPTDHFTPGAATWDPMPEETP